MNYYEHHLGDYMRDTAHLSVIEDGAYRRLLDAYYTRERPLPPDLRECCKLARANTKQEREAVAYILREFFVLKDAGHTNARAEKEIERFRNKSNKARESVAKRWERTKNVEPTDCECNTNAPAESYERNTEAIHRAPVPSNQSPVTSLVAELQTADRRKALDPAPPPPAFDGTNTEALNGKSVVCLAVGFSLPEPWGMDAEALGFKPVEVMREAEKFRQFFVAGRGSGTRRSVKGWRQSWSNWLGKAAKDSHR